jgi:serine phosphatase RsbU (regulator of sigma subunit)
VASAPLPRGKQLPAATSEKPEPGPSLRGHPAVKRQPAPPGLNIPIAIKFALAITVLVLILMAWQTANAMRVAEESQDAAINESGIKDVCALASTLDPAWIEDPKLRKRLEETLQRYCAATGELGVLNAVVYSPGGGPPLATGKAGEASFNISEKAQLVAFRRAAEAGVLIHELEYNGQPVRRFSREIPVERDGSKRAIGSVEVLLSAQRISESRDATRDRMVMVSLAAAGAAAVLSFLLAAFLTYPIRTLARDLRQVGRGDLEHQSQVRTGDEIGDLARAFNHMTANLLHAEDARVAQKAMEHELNLATRIQNRLLPPAIPQVSGFDIASYYHPAREVGGDYYDFLAIDPENLGFVVADVSGKGVPGSLVMTMTRSLLRMAAAGRDSPAETVKQVNRILAPDIGPGMFVTLLYFVLHIPSRRVRLVRAGHNAPLLYVARAARLVALQPRGIALGLDPRGPLFDSELEVQQFTLQGGDFLVAYTDGIVEGKNGRGECYSDERFREQVAEGGQESARSMTDRVIADLASHRGGAEQSDDITLLVVKKSLER